MVFGGCLPDRVAGAFFRVETGSGSDSDTDSDPEPASLSVDSSKSDSESNISVGRGSFRDGVSLGGAGTSPVSVVVQSRWLNRGGSPLPFRVRREGYVGLDLLESRERERSLSELRRSASEPAVRVAEVREEVRKIVL